MIPAGCFFVVRTGGLVAAVIRLGTRSQVNHAGIVLADGRTTVEAQPHGARYGRLPDDLTRYVFNDLQPLTDRQRADICAAAEGMIGTPYSYLGVAALALVCVGLRWPWLERRVARSDDQFCSELVDWIYQLAKVHLFKDGRAKSAVNPGHLLMYIAGHDWQSV